MCACEFSCKRGGEFGGGRREGSWEEGRGEEVGWGEGLGRGAGWEEEEEEEDKGEESLELLGARRYT